MITVGKTLLKAILLDLVTKVTAGNYTGVLNSAYIGLMTSNVNLGPGTLIADLVEPIYTGYARLAVGTWLGPFLEQDGSYNITAPEAFFQMGDTAHPTTVTGYFLADAVSAGNFLLGEKFATPFSLTTTDQAVLVAPDINMPVSVNLGTGLIE